MRVPGFPNPYRRFSRWWWGFWFSPRTWRRFFVGSFQRVTRGWADEDVWDMRSHLDGILPEMLEHMRDTTPGVPGVLCDGGVEAGMIRWASILTDTAAGFRAHAEIEERFLHEGDPDYAALNERWVRAQRLLFDYYEGLWT